MAKKEKKNRSQEEAMNKVFKESSSKRPSGEEKRSKSIGERLGPGSKSMPVGERLGAGGKGAASSASQSRLKSVMGKGSD